MKEAGQAEGSMLFSKFLQNYKPRAEVLKEDIPKYEKMIDISKRKKRFQSKQRSFQSFSIREAEFDFGKFMVD